jgi:ArsR family transcriptional regulator
MKTLERYFKALADATRLRILNLLLNGEMCVCDIQLVLGTSQPNVSRHLSYLKNAGLVLDRRAGYRIFYRLADPAESRRKRLYRFLREVYAKEGTLAADKKRLQAVMEAGACTLPEGESVLRSKRRPAAHKGART